MSRVNTFEQSGDSHSNSQITHLGAELLTGSQVICRWLLLQNRKAIRFIEGSTSIESCTNTCCQRSLRRATSGTILGLSCSILRHNSPVIKAPISVAVSQDKSPLARSIMQCHTNLTPHTAISKQIPHHLSDDYGQSVSPGEQWQCAGKY